MDVSIITINYNTSVDTVECVQSIIEHTHPSLEYEIIVVDNNSDLKDYENLKSILPKANNIHLHRSVINTGFGGGNMFGVQFASDSKYFAFINNDAVVEDDCFNFIHNYMNENQKVGVCGPRVIKESGEVINGFGHFHNLLQHFVGVRTYEKISKKPKIGIDYKEVLEVDFVLGSFMFFGAEVFKKVGGFDNNIFLYYEEMDICFRLKQVGFDTVYNPLRTYVHKEGKSSQSGVDKNKWILTRKEQQISYNYFFRKNYGKVKYYIMYCFVIFKMLVKSIVNPVNFHFLVLHLKGNPLHYSLKQTQRITTNPKG